MPHATFAQKRACIGSSLPSKLPTRMHMARGMPNAMMNCSTKTCVQIGMDSTAGHASPSRGHKPLATAIVHSQPNLHDGVRTGQERAPSDSADGMHERGAAAAHDARTILT